MLRSLQRTHHVALRHERSFTGSLTPRLAEPSHPVRVHADSQLFAPVAVRALKSAAASSLSRISPANHAVIAAASDGAEEALQQAVIGTSNRFTEAELKQLWDSVSRSLLKLGKPGVTETHSRSLMELVGSHKLVKVQHNGARGDADAVVAAAAQLQKQSAGGVELLHIKGSTMLFCSSILNNEQLLAVAEAETASTAVWKTKRAAAAAERQQQRASLEAKKNASASRSRRRIGQLINTVAAPSKGPLDKGSLAQEWQQLASSIAAEEAAEDSGQQKQRKTPWKK